MGWVRDVDLALSSLTRKERKVLGMDRCFLLSHLSAVGFRLMPTIALAEVPALAS